MNTRTTQWSGGQYSLFRMLFGFYLVIHFTHLLPWGVELFSSAGMVSEARMSPLSVLMPNIFLIYDAPWFVTTLIATGSFAALCFMFGFRSRIAAFWMWVLMFSLLGRNVMISNPAMPYVGWMLLAHCFMPCKPYGANGADPLSAATYQWRMPREIFIAAWVVLGLSYSYSGYTKLLSPTWLSGETLGIVLENPLARDHFLRSIFLAMPDWFLKFITIGILYVELLFAPLALFRSLRVWVWGIMLFVQFGFLTLLNLADLTTGMLMFHLFTFNPDWLRAKSSGNKIRLFYDGYCGFCQATVRLVLAEDQLDQFRFAPLSSPSFVAAVGAERARTLPMSMVLVDEHARVYCKSDAVIFILQHLGGLWRALAYLLRIIPRPLRDLGYDIIGRVRYKLGKRPENECPLLPAELAKKFST